MKITEKEASYFMSRMKTIGPVSCAKLTLLYGSAARAWEENTVPLNEKNQCAEWNAFHTEEKQQELLREIKYLEEQGIRYIIPAEEEFPEPLRRISDPPIGLFVRGTLPKSWDKCVAMVGARRCTEYGRVTARELGRALAEEGITVVSGMAMGIDAESQWGAIEAGGCSIGVLGCGIDICYPPSNARLYGSLTRKGALISEYGPGEPGLPFHFPLRNRLISGLARAVLVLEAREKSGSLITVDYALEQGKDVLALPGRIGDPLSQGCNQLIRQGAGILTGVSDVLAALGDLSEEQEQREREAADPLLGLSEASRQVLEQIGTDPVHPEAIAAKSGLRMSEIFTPLWDLECRGLVRVTSGGLYLTTNVHCSHGGRRK